MAASSGQWGFKNERSKKRRHSYTSARGFAAKPTQPRSPLTPTHVSSTFSRSGSYSSGNQSTDSTDHVALSRGGRRRSFVNFFRSKSRKRRNMSSSLLGDNPATKKERNRTSSLPGQDRTPTSFSLSEHKEEFIRVIATVLHPQIIYKTLHITRYTTVYEVIVKLVNKYAYSMEDQNPDAFYLTEVRESEQGSYSRLLENSERVYEVQARWKEGKKCSFTLCRKEIFKVEDDPFLDNPMQAMIMSPSQDSFYNGFSGLDNGFSGVVDIEVPSTPTSPNTYNAKSSFFDEFTPSTDESIGGLLPKSAFPISPSELSAKEVSFATRQPIALSNPPQQGSPEELSAESSQQADVSRLMQKSVSEGMLGIMKKVVTESKNSPLVSKGKSRHRRAETDTTHEASPSSSRAGVVLRPLVCSPMESAQKRFPEFIFTPKVANSSTNKQDTSESDDVVAKQLNLEETDNGTANLKKDISSRAQSRQTPQFKTSHTLSAVKFECACVFHPQYHCSASLYPSFSRSMLFTTEMDMTNTLTGMLESQLKPPATDDLHSTKITSSSQLRENNTPTKAATKSSLKRPHTFHVRRDHLQLHIQDDEEVLPSLRDQLIGRAALAIRQRHSLSSLRLTEGEALSKHTRQGSSSSNLSRRGSTISISSEVESDLDALLDLKTRNLSICSASSEQSLPGITLRVVHRTDSDGDVQMSNQRPPHRLRRASSSTSNSSIQGAGPLHSVPTESTYLKPHFPTTLSSSKRRGSASSLRQQSSYLQQQASGLDYEETDFRGSNEHIRRGKGRLYKSVEVINSLEHSENVLDENDEVLYTFQSNFRPVTVLLRSKSSHTLEEDQKQNTRITKSSQNLYDSKDHTGERTEEGEGVFLSASGGRREIWTFSQRRTQRKIKSWLSEL